MSKKDLLAKILSKSRLIILIRIFRALFPKPLIILAYHRIYDMKDENSFPFDPELISATPEDFKLQIEHLSQYFNPITFEDLLEFQNGNRKLPKDPVIITFDDGHTDNYTNAYPILKNLNTSATIFVSSDYLDSDDTFWFDQIAYFIYKTEKSNLSLNSDDFSICFNESIKSKRLATETTLRYLMTLQNSLRLSCIDELKNQLDVTISTDDQLKSSALSTDQVAEMSKNNIEFGSHTASHPILSKLTSTELEHELKQSKIDIERITNKPVNTIAYPVGGTSEFNQNVIIKCKETGYQFGISYISGIEQLPITSPYKIKRLHVERYTNMDYFKAMLVIPEIFK